MGGSSPIVNNIMYTLARLVTRPMVRRRYGYTTDLIPEVGEPYLMISNHTTEDDMLLVGMASRKPMYFVCGEHLLRNKVYGKALRVLMNPIALPKGGASMNAVKEILGRLRKGYNVCMFPEGKRSFHGETIPASIALGKLVKKSGRALVTYRIRGGYFTYPRWARKHKRTGHVEGKVMGVYSSEDLAEMTAQEVTDIINRDTYENAYQTQRRERWVYRGTDLAKGMEHVLFMCPKCGGMDSIQTEGDSFRCEKCGMEGTYNEYGFLEGRDLPFDNVHSWMRWIEKEFDGLVGRDDGSSPLFNETGVLLYQMMDNYENKDILTDDLKVYRDRMVLGDREFVFSDINYLSMLFGNILLFTYGEIYYGLSGDAFHAWKCARLWHLVKGDTEDRTKEI